MSDNILHEDRNIPNIAYLKVEQPKVLETILEEAQRLIDSVKVADYDTVDVSHKRIAVLWSEVLGRTITEREVAMCMIMLKLSREIANHKRDNLVDIAGYAYCIEKLENKGVSL